MAGKTMGRVIDPCAFYTSRELEGLIDKSRPTLARWRQTGEGPAYARAGPRMCLYSGRSILEWLEGRTFKSIAVEADALAARAIEGV